MARTFTRNLGNYVMLGNNAIGPLIDGASAVSVSCWVRFNSFIAAPGTGENHFFSIYSSLNTISLRTLNSKIQASGRSQSSDVSQIVNGTTTLTAGVLYHVGVVFNYAASNVSIYLNGTLETTVSVTWSRTTYLNATATSNDAIGSATNLAAPVSTTLQLDGEMAELGTWKTALNAADFASLAKGFTPDQIRPQSLVAYWPMIGSTSTVTELSNAKNGTITGSVPATNHPRVYS